MPLLLHFRIKKMTFLLQKKKNKFGFVKKFVSLQSENNFIYLKNVIMEDRHAEAIPADIVTVVKTKLNEIKTLLLPYVVSLTASERKSLLKMGEKSLAFVGKAFDYAVENPEFVPPFLDMTAFSVDIGDARGLWTINNDARQVYEMIDDTEMASGSEAFRAALIFYHSVKVAAGNDIPGAKAIYEELKKRFPGHKANNDEGEE
jgi:hypothetical protein